MSLTRREAIAAMIGGAAGWAAGCGAGETAVPSQAKLDRLEAVRRRRRIIFVDDNYGLSHEGSDTPEGFLAPPAPAADRDAGRRHHLRRLRPQSGLHQRGSEKALRRGRGNVSHRPGLGP